MTHARETIEAIRTTFSLAELANIAAEALPVHVRLPGSPRLTLEADGDGFVLTQWLSADHPIGPDGRVLPDRQ